MTETAELKNIILSTARKILAEDDSLDPDWAAETMRLWEEVIGPDISMDDMHALVKDAAVIFSNKSFIVRDPNLIGVKPWTYSPGVSEHSTLKVTAIEAAERLSREFPEHVWSSACKGRMSFVWSECRGKPVGTVLIYEITEDGIDTITRWIV